MIAQQQIEQLHRLYVSLTGLDVALDADRLRVWFEWLRYRARADALRAMGRSAESSGEKVKTPAEILEGLRKFKDSLK